MSRNLLVTVGASSVDNLTGDNLIYQNRTEVLLPAGDTFHRGQVLVLADDGINALMPTDATEIIDCILLDEVGETTEITKAAVSLTGQWNQNSVLWGGILEQDIPEVIKRTRSERQLDIAPQHQAPFVQFGGVN